MFVAVPLADEVSGALEAALAPWRQRLAGARWVAPEGRHITLKFLGWTPPRLREVVERACREAAAGAAPFEVTLSGMGVFPRPSSARVLWAGIEDPGSRLQDLAEALESRLARDFPPERRGFTPHLTVARFRPPADVRAHAEALATVRFETRALPVDRLVLFRSTLRPGGAVYDPLGEFPLAR